MRLMTSFMRTHLTGVGVGLLGMTMPLFAQDNSVESRLDKLEQENGVLRDQVDSMSGQLESFEFRDIIPPIGDSFAGMGPAASKIYSKESGLSIGGYGEMVYESPSGPDPARADFLRNIIYLGYKFDERWVFNSEIEIEHADEIYLEFAYLEYLQSEAMSVRAGMLLIPMGIINEMHEPTTYRGSARPETERRIIPTTWRENGVGLLGSSGDFSYKFYVTSGLNAEGFDADGLRGGRQKGSKALSQDLAATARVDWALDNGLDLGLSGYYGDSGQDQAGLSDAPTAIYEAHAQYQWRGLRCRGLFAMADVGDTVEISNTVGSTVAEEMEGWYLEAGYDIISDLAPESGQSVIPFVRYEEVDTQASVAAGLTPDPIQDDTIVTMGVDWKPIDNIVFKASYQDFDKTPDSLQFSLGYVF